MREPLLDLVQTLFGNGVDARDRGAPAIALASFAACTLVIVLGSLWLAR